MDGHSLDVAHMLAGGMVLVSFMLLYQDRMFALLNVFALHAVVLSASVAWQAYIQNAPHLYVPAAIALVLKGIIIPVALHRVVIRLGIHRTIETVGGIGLTMLFGIGLVALSMVVMLKAAAAADPLAREDLAFALSVLLLGLLMMVTRRNAVSQIVGFMSLENGLILAATGATGMPLGRRDQRGILGADRLHRHRRVPVPHPRAVRFRRLAGARRVSRGAAVTALFALPFDPLQQSWSSRLRRPCCWSLLPGYWLTARLNVLAALLTFVAALSLLVVRPAPAAYLFVDDLNIVFIVLDHLRRLHYQRLQRQLHRSRAGDRPAHAPVSALLPCDVPDPDVRHEPWAHSPTTSA